VVAGASWPVRDAMNPPYKQLTTETTQSVIWTVDLLVRTDNYSVMTSSTREQAPDRARFTPDLRRVVIVVVLAAIMSMLDATIVNVALRTLALDLQTSLSTIQWAVTAYLLALAAVIPATGWTANRFGTKRMFVLSAAGFTVASLLCGLARSPAQLIAFRAIQGVAGGLLVPIGQMILVKTAGPARMARVMSAVGVPMFLAPVIGPTVGGLLIDHAGWPWIFYLNLPIGAAATILAIRLLPHDHTEHPGALDFPGLLLVSLAIVGITYGLAETGANGDAASPRVLVTLLTGGVLLAAFAVRALHIPRPLLDIRLFGDRVFSAAALTTFGLGAAMFGGMILMPLYYQIVRGQDAVATGLLLAPQGVGATIALILSARSTERLGPGLTSLIGGIISILATLPLVFLGADSSYLFLCLTMLIRGLGIGMSAMPAMTAAFQALPQSKINDATPQLNILQRVGGSVGTAVLAVVLQRQLNHATKPAAQAQAFGTTFWWVLGLTVAATLPTLLLIHTERRRQRG
jgi:EmrB/QacA subfamily drug resistance transporter